MRMPTRPAAALLALAALLVLDAAVAAQTAQPIQNFEILVISSDEDPATAAPVVTNTIAVAPTSANCNLAPVPPPADTTTPLVNPARALVDDPFNAGRQCDILIPDVPDGSYVVVARYLGTCQPDPLEPVAPCESLRSEVGVPPFVRIRPTPARPPAPTGLILSR